MPQLAAMMPALLLPPLLLLQVLLQVLNHPAAGLPHGYPHRCCCCCCCCSSTASPSFGCIPQLHASKAHLLHEICTAADRTSQHVVVACQVLGG
jgi:hypothetical protein